MRCANASDIANALEFAQRKSLPLAIRGGGHSRAGFGVCDGGVVIDLSRMNRVVVDMGDGMGLPQWELSGEPSEGPEWQVPGKA